MSELAVSVKNVSKTFTIYEHNTDTIRSRVLNVIRGNEKRKLKALNNINFEVNKGDFFGIIGHNGSGKSSLMRIMTQAIPADAGGTVSVNGSYVKLALGIGFSNELTAKQNVYLNSSILGLSLKEIDEKFDEIIEFAEAEKFVHTPLKYFSSGMRSKLGFAVAIHSKADILFLDEFFGGVGDVRYRNKAKDAFNTFIASGKTVVLITHSMETVKEHCNKVLLLKNGEMQKMGTPDEVVSVYLADQNIPIQKAKQKQKRKKNDA